MPNQLTVTSPGTLEQQSAALRLVLGDTGEAAAAEQVAAIVSAAQTGQLSLAGLLTACRDKRLVGAAWSLVQPGRTALVWPPRLIPEEPDGTANELLAQVLAGLVGLQIRVAQAALPSTQGSDAARLLAHGFLHAADLLYLACGEPDFPAMRPRHSFGLETVTPDCEERLIRLLNRTYHETQDCPQLNGVRNTRDVLEGYRHTGVFSPERWLIASENHLDLGCLLLADHPAEEQWELVYMGVAPEARGRQLGFALTRHAQWLTRAAGRSRLVLAVDARNEPALAIYSSAGFEPFEHRAVLLRVFEDSPGACAFP